MSLPTSAIQHNISAMGAFRNYKYNNSMLSKSLQKLSSGYKINSAADDAAGLAISEKMRAQITGIEVAQKNAKDGISLVQTAEGALTEVHDMLNRMVTLATESANGTYADNVDREQIQKEIDQLNSEIDRIADSANFNGIKLLDGSLTAQNAKTDVTIHTVNDKGSSRAIQDIIEDGARTSAAVGKKTITEKYTGSAKAASFRVNLNGISWNPNDVLVGTASATATVNMPKMTLTIGDWSITTNDTGKASAGGIQVKVTSDGSITFGTAAKNLGGKPIADAIMGAIKTQSSTGNATVTINGVKWTVSTETKAMGTTASNIVNGGDAGSTSKLGTYLVFTQKNKPETASQANANFGVSIDFFGSVSASEVGNGAKVKWADTNQLNGGTEVISAGQAPGDNRAANTIFRIDAADIKDGAKIKFGYHAGATSTTLKAHQYVLKVGPDSTVASASGWTVVDLTSMDPDNIDLDYALNKIYETMASKVTKTTWGAAYSTKGNVMEFQYKGDKGDSEVVHLEFGVSNSQSGYPTGLTINRVDTIDSASNGPTAVVFKKLSDFDKVFQIGYSYQEDNSLKAQSGLTLQIGDSADSFNQLKVSIANMHTKALGINGLDVSTQEAAQAAIDKINNAINLVSDTRGTLGATQNRLDHTINNLGVMQENLQSAESAIRDTDVAEEMMNFTKWNIMNQAAQAMLAQANQLPQAALQMMG